MIWQHGSRAGTVLFFVVEFSINFSSNDNNSKTVCCNNEAGNINGCYKCHLFETFTDHGNHTEDSPFLSTDAAAKKNEFYDRNLALFEVCLVACFFFLNFATSLFLNWQRMQPNLFTDNSSSIPPPGGDGHPTEGFLSAQPLGHLHQHHAGSEGARGGGEQSGLKQKGSQGQCALCFIFFNPAFLFGKLMLEFPPPPFTVRVLDLN